MTKVTLKKVMHAYPTGTRALLIAVVLGLGFYGYQSFKSAPAAPPADTKIVEIQVVKTQNIDRSIRLIGTVKPKNATTLLAEASGSLEVLVPAGQRVKKGTLIAKIDNIDVEKNLDLSESSERIAETQFGRAQALLKVGHVSKQSVENKKNALLTAQRDLASAKIALRKIRFYAPFDGIVGVYKVREGAQVSVGDPIVNVYDPSGLIVDFEIPSSTLPFVKDNQPMVIEGKKYTLLHAQQMMDSETHMSPAYVDYTGTDCVIGASVDVDLTVQQKENTIVIPFDAIFLKDSKPRVYLVVDNKTVLTPVELGLREKEQVEILSGLKPGDKVITAGQSRLYPGTDVKIHDPNAKAEAK